MYKILRKLILRFKSNSQIPQKYINRKNLSIYSILFVSKNGFSKVNLYTLRRIDLFAVNLQLINLIYKRDL